MASDFLYDGVPVNDRVDWRGRLTPTRPAIREERIPGVKERFIVQETAKPPFLELAGIIEATGGSASAARDNLYTELLVWYGRQGDGQVHTVTIGGTPFSNLALVNFNTTGPITIVNGIKAIQPVLMEFIQLR